MRWLVVTCLACGCAATPGSQDAGPDAGVDGGPGADAGTDAGVDAGTDAGVDAGQPVLQTLTAAQLYAALQAKDFLLLDVHVPAADHLPGTDARIAYTDTAGLVAFIGTDLDRKVVLTCASGGMSSVAGAALVARGYRNIWHLLGGTSAWVAAGYTLVP